jgi:hypothetical protein
MAEVEKTPGPEWPSAPPKDLKVTVEHRVRRLSGSVVLDAALGLLNAERGLLFTLREFAVRPRRAFEDYLGPGRLNYAHPLKTVFFLSALAAFLMHQLPVPALSGSGSRGALTAEEAEAAAFAARNYNLLLLASIPAMAVASWGFYWNRAYNLFEHIALNSFQVSVITVAYFVTLPLIALWPNTLLFYALLCLLYQAWLYRRVLGSGWLRAAVATLGVTVAYITSMSALGRFWRSVSE